MIQAVIVSHNDLGRAARGDPARATERASGSRPPTSTRSSGPRWRAGWTSCCWTRRSRGRRRWRPRSGRSPSPAASPSPASGSPEFGLVLVELLEAGVNAILPLPPDADWDDRLMRLVHVPARKVSRFPVQLRGGGGPGPGRAVHRPGPQPERPRAAPRDRLSPRGRRRPAAGLRPARESGTDPGHRAPSCASSPRGASGSSSPRWKGMAGSGSSATSRPRPPDPGGGL